MHKLFQIYHAKALSFWLMIGIKAFSKGFRCIANGNIITGCKWLKLSKFCNKPFNWHYRFLEQET